MCGKFCKCMVKTIRYIKLLKKYMLCERFPDVDINLKTLTISATLAIAEKSFSKLKLIKHFLRFTNIMRTPSGFNQAE